MVAKQCKRHKNTVSNILKEYREKRDDFDISLASEKPGNCGRHRNHGEELSELIKEKIEGENGDITYRELLLALQAESVNISFSCMYQFRLQMGIKTQSSHVKPRLTHHNEMHRLKFVLYQIETPTTQRQTLRFKSQRNRVHIDEKFFHLERLKVKRKIIPGGKRSGDESVQSKRHRTQVMFLVAITQPFGDFDGKLSLMPFVEETVAQRNSINRPAGTIEFKPYSVDSANFYEDLTMEDGLLNAIAEGMKDSGVNHVIVQMDNAPGHTGKDNPAKIDRWIEENDVNMSISFPQQSRPQPLRSHLLRIPAGQVRSPQKGQERGPNPGLMDAVEEACDDYDKETLERLFGHLYACYNEILKCEGSNQYNPPHVGTRKNQASGTDLDLVCIDRNKYKRLKRIVATCLMLN